jgi:hypothetical protein
MYFAEHDIRMQTLSVGAKKTEVMNGFGSAHRGDLIGILKTHMML